MVIKTKNTRIFLAIFLFILTASIITANIVPASTAEVPRPTIPDCTLDIIAGDATLHLTNNTIADYIQAGYLTELVGGANMTGAPNGGTSWYMDQYKGVSILALIDLVCDLQINSSIIVNSTDNFPTTFNYTAIANGQLNTYTNTSTLAYSSGKFLGTSGAWSQVPHSIGEVLTPIIAYYVNPVNNGTSNGPTSYAGWQAIGVSNGPLRNVVLGCSNQHYTWSKLSSKFVTQIIITNPGTIHVIPEFPFSSMLPITLILTAVGVLVALKKRSNNSNINIAVR